VELDLRDKFDGNIVVTHDAYNDGDTWTNYLTAYQHNLMIANIKTEGIEQDIIRHLEKAGHDNYFLLDVSLPFLIKLSNLGIRKMAVRYSKYEPIELATQFINKVDWVWVDCFDGFPLNIDAYTLLKKHFKICMVSPELHGKSTEDMEDFKNKLITMPVDAVCTKYPHLWE
jgi:hypothetical protein